MLRVSGGCVNSWVMLLTGNSSFCLHTLNDSIYPVGCVLSAAMQAPGDEPVWRQLLQQLNTEQAALK